MRTGLLVAAVLLGACTTEPSVTTHPDFNFACRLPVTWIPTDAIPDASNSGTAFLSLPDETLVDVAPRPTAWPFTDGPSYDAVAGRWLPVPASVISPDGSFYAYADYDPPAAGLRSSAVHEANAPVIGTTGRVHVVDARTGSDVIVFAGQPTYRVVAFTAVGLYLTEFRASIGGTASSGLFVLDLSGGAPRAVPGAGVELDRGGWRVIEGGAAWGTRFTEGPGAMWSGNQLVRFDLATHAISTWITVPIEDFVAILGFEGSHALVFTQKASYSQGDTVTAKVVLLTGPDQATQVMTTDNPSDTLPSTAMPAEADSHGLWIGGLGTLWLYQPGSGLRHMNVVGPDSIVEVGGGCA